MSHFISLHFATQQKLCLLHWQSLTWVAGMLMSDMRTWRFRNPFLHSHMMGQIKSSNHIVSNSRFHRFPFQLCVCTLCGHRWGNTKSLPRFGVTSALSNSATLFASIWQILGHHDIIQPHLRIFNCPAFWVPHFHQVLPFQGVHQNRLTTTSIFCICISSRWVTKIENEGMCRTLLGFPVTSAKICVWCQVSTLFIVQKAHLWHCFLTLELKDSTWTFKNDKKT